MSAGDQGETYAIPCPHCGEQTATPLAVILGGGAATCSQCRQGFTVESSVSAEVQERLQRSAKTLSRTVKP